MFGKDLFAASYRVDDYHLLIYGLFFGRRKRTFWLWPENYFDDVE
jgi:hypothetical protein